VEKHITLDHEWIELIKEARDQGFTKDELIEIFKNPQLMLEEMYVTKKYCLK
jgi:hypothetical protein